MSWNNAQNYCRQNYTDLFTVRNMDVNDKLTTMIQEYTCAWIGLFRDSWKWSDQTSTSLVQWAAGQPDNSFGSEICGAVDNDGHIADERCSKQFFFFCNGKFNCFYFSTFCGCFQVLFLYFFSCKIQTSCLKMAGRVYN